MTVGWYVHHHGAGHRQRLAACVHELEDVVALGSVDPEAGCPWVPLPWDLADPPRDPSAGGTLHWAPVGHDGHRERMAAISGWIVAARPSVMVVDVSVEVALLARLHGVPTVVIAQRGLRTDPAHALAFAQAAAIVAPWTRATHLWGEGLPDDRVRFAGAISRFAPSDAPPTHPDDILLLVGAGGHALTWADVDAAAVVTGRTWHVAGALLDIPEGAAGEQGGPRRVLGGVAGVGGRPSGGGGAGVGGGPSGGGVAGGRSGAGGARVVAHGAQADVEALLARCGVVVGSAGGNVVAEVAAFRRPFVCLPQPRPFAEQGRQGEALRRLGVAEVLDGWPPAVRWPALLAAAAAGDTRRWALLHDGDGARRLAAVVAEVGGACGCASSERTTTLTPRAAS